MATTKLTRYTQKIFAGDSGAQELAAFATMQTGSPVYTDNIETLQNSNYEKGWTQAVVMGFAPFLEEFNAVQYAFSYQLAYLLQNGVAEWSASENYFINSWCQYGGELYQSQSANNLNNNPSTDNGTNWVKKSFIDIATDAQAAAGLLETVAINPKQLASVQSGLQTQIDAITASSDVKDVVGTYTDLQNYNTSTLGNNDIIKVLQDSTQNNETTYYRWVITNDVGAWVLIGSEGPYYTISSANNTFVKNTDIATASTVGIIKVGNGLNIANDGTLSVASQATPIISISNSGTITLTDNTSYKITPTGNITFSLPTITDLTVVHKIEVELNMSTVYSVNLGLGATPLYFNKTAPDLSNAGTYNLLYQYSPTENAWYCGGAIIGVAA